MVPSLEKAAEGATGGNAVSSPPPSQARSHGDPFPLPVPPVCSVGAPGDLPRYLRQRRCCQQALDFRVRDAAQAINALASCTAQRGPGQGRAAAVAPTASQSAVWGRIRPAIAEYGDRPRDADP